MNKQEERQLCRIGRIILLSWLIFVALMLLLKVYVLHTQ